MRPACPSPTTRVSTRMRYAARHAGGGVTAADLARYGRITGYTLDYALPLASARPAAHSLLGVQTIAELYRGRIHGDERARVLARCHESVEREEGERRHGGLSPFEARVGDGAFAFELTYRRAGRPILYVGDVVFRTGDLLGAVFVTAGDRKGPPADGGPRRPARSEDPAGGCGQDSLMPH